MDNNFYPLEIPLELKLEAVTLDDGEVIQVPPTTYNDELIWIAFGLKNWQQVHKCPILRIAELWVMLKLNLDNQEDGIKRAITHNRILNHIAKTQKEIDGMQF